MDCEHWREKFTDFIEDSLPAAQRQQMEDHLRQCPHCAEELEAFRRAVTALRELPTVAAPSDLPVRIRQALPTPQRVFGYRISWQAVGAIAAAACLLVGFWAIFSWQQPAGITARRQVTWPPPPTPQPTQAPREIATAPEAEELPIAPPQPEAEPGGAPIVSHEKLGRRRSARPAPTPPTAPSLKTKQTVPAPGPPPAPARDALVPGAPLVEREGVTIAEATRAEDKDLVALATRPPAAPEELADTSAFEFAPRGAGVGGARARVTFEGGESAVEEAASLAEEQVAGVKVTVTPPKQRVVGREVQVKVIIEPERDVAEAIVRVKTEGTLQVTPPGAVVYCGPLKAGQQNMVNFGIIAAEIGTQRLTVELSSEVPGISASVSVPIPDFHKPQPPPDTEPQDTEADNGAESGSD